MTAEWLQVLLDGSVGAVFGAVASFLAAYWAIRRQARLDREMFRRERSSSAAVLLARTINGAMQDMLKAQKDPQPAGLAEAYNEISARIAVNLPEAVYLSADVYNGLATLSTTLRVGLDDALSEQEQLQTLLVSGHGAMQQMNFLGLILQDLAFDVIRRSTPRADL